MSSGNASQLVFDLPLSGGSSHSQFGIPAGLMGSQIGSVGSHQKAGGNGGFMNFGEDEPVLPMGGADFPGFDADGNLVEVPEPELPPLPQGEEYTQIPREGQLKERERNAPEKDMMVFMEEEQLPEVEASHQNIRPNIQDPYTIQNPDMNAGEAAASSMRTRCRKIQNFFDEQTEICTAELRDREVAYGERMDAAVAAKNRKGTLATNPKTAKKNAFLLTVGFGINNVGAPTGIRGVDSPLAKFFAGGALGNAIFGVPNIDYLRASPEGNRRRSASEAFGEEEEEEGEEERRVRSKTGGEPEQGLIAGQEEDGISFEAGREQPVALPEHPSSTGMPWSRHGSAVPSSAIKMRHGAGSNLMSDPPVRGSQGDFERLASDGGIPIHSDGFMQLASQHSSLDLAGGTPFLQFQHDSINADSQLIHAAADRASEEFLGYATEEARQSGKEEEGRTWVSFEKLAEPGIHSKEVAAKAFYYTLALATKDRIKVKQAGGSQFGEVFLGLTVPESDLGGVEKTIEEEEEGGDPMEEDNLSSEDEFGI